jgi:hypothetical protein
MESNKITSIFISSGGNKSDYQNVLAIASLVNPDDHRIYLMLYRENMCINFPNITKTFANLIIKSIQIKKKIFHYRYIQC